MSDLSILCRHVLQENDAGGYTVPTKGLYPFQWLWDSGFSALGWQTFDEPRAWLELRTLMSAQWPDGMVPHIVHHRTDTGYTLDHTWWDAPGPVPSSGITQPPVLASVVRRMLERSGDPELAEREVRYLIPKLLAFHRWFFEARDPDATGLVAVIHPWEGGMDDSPVWDEALARVPALPLERPRPDTAHVDASQRPSDAQYERYAALVARYRERDYDAEACMRDAPFKVVGVVLNAVLSRANRDLLALVGRFDLAGGDEIAEWIRRGDAGMDSLWDDEASCYFSRDLMTGDLIRVRTWETFMPLYSGQASAIQAQRLSDALTEIGERVAFSVPSTHPDEDAFDPRRYWRGPVWMPVNWMLALGCREYGFREQASRLEQDVVELVRREGLREYYDPLRGDGLGGGAFSWTAALLLDWSRTGIIG